MNEMEIVVPVNKWVKPAAFHGPGMGLRVYVHMHACILPVVAVVRSNIVCARFNGSKEGMTAKESPLTCLAHI